MFHRPAFSTLSRRLAEAPRLIQIVAGPRQVGKTTVVRQLLDTDRRPETSFRFVAVDAIDQRRLSDASYTFSPAGAARDAAWLTDVWHEAQAAAARWIESPDSRATPFVLAIDEIQRVRDWSAVIKGLWDALRASGPPMHIVLLGSSPLLMQRGLSESLAGRFELIRLTHWSLAEMQDAFGFELEDYVYFGGYPGSAQWLREEARWRDYVRAALIKPSIETDILMMTRVDKPALLRQMFEIGCLYSGQIVALDKLLGQMVDAGNVTTLARYLDLLGDAGLLVGLQKHSDGAIRRRRAPPKLQALNNALVTAQGSHTRSEARLDRSHWGRLVESCFGAHLVNSADGDTQVRFWREGSLEVDFVVEHRGKLAAIEVKSAPKSLRHSGLEEFSRRHPGCKVWQVGTDRMPLDEALQRPAASWTDG